MTAIRMKRIYELPAPGDGFRVLAARLWPRGMKKEAAQIDLWARDITPTTGLRKDFHSGKISWQEFAGAYQAELLCNPALDEFTGTIKNKKAVTLLFAGKDTDHSHVKVLANILKQRLK